MNTTNIEPPTNVTETTDQTAENAMLQKSPPKDHGIVLSSLSNGTQAKRHLCHQQRIH